MDSQTGWFAYLMPHDVLFVKRYPVYPDRLYGEVAGLTISIWYDAMIRCELEPIGPLEHLNQLVLQVRLNERNRTLHSLCNR